LSEGGWRHGATRVARFASSGSCNFGLPLLGCRGDGPGFGVMVVVYGQMLLCNLGCDLLGCATLWLACGRWTSGRQPQNVVTVTSWMSGWRPRDVVLVEVLAVDSFVVLSLPTSCRVGDEVVLDASSQHHVGASRCRLLHQRRSILCLLLP
jgi:hypothetical protein